MEGRGRGITIHMDSTRYVEKRRKGHHHPNELHLVENG
jgi:hypothetical protein